MVSFRSGGRRYALVAAVPAALCLALVGANAATGAPPATPGPAQAVVVTNGPTQPVPVAPQGTTPVSGTVAISGTPTVKSADQTVALHSGPTTPFGNEQRTSGKVAVAGHGTIRVSADVLCDQPVGATIDVFSTYGGLSQRRIDGAGSPGAVAQLNATYEVPGTEIEVVMACSGGITDGTVVVLGRP